MSENLDAKPEEYGDRHAELVKEYELWMELARKDYFTSKLSKALSERPRELGYQLIASPNEEGIFRAKSDYYEWDIYDYKAGERVALLRIRVSPNKFQPMPGSFVEWVRKTVDTIINNTVPAEPPTLRFE